MTADTVGGVWTYALDLSRELVRSGLTVGVAVLGPSASASQAEAMREAGAAVIDTGLPLDWLSEDPNEVSAAGAALNRVADDFGAELLHLNHPALGAGHDGSRLMIAVAHSCVATWWRAVRGGEAIPGDFAWRTALTGEGYRRAARVIAPSHAFAAATQAVYHLPSPPVAVWNGRRPLSGAPTRSVTREVLTAGRLWDEGKGVATLDAAAARLDAKVEAAGPLHGPNGAATTLLNAMPLGFLSERELAARLAERPVFASAALYEPFGLSVLEAAQAGCALALSDIPTHRELWDDAAVFFPPRDERGAAEALAALLDDPERRAAAGSAARERAARYSVARMADGVRAVYAEALAGERAA